MPISRSPRHAVRLWDPQNLPFSDYRRHSSGVERLERGADHCPPSCAEVKHAWTVTWLRQIVAGILLRSFVVSLPILVAARSKAWAFGHSLTEITGSNPSWGMDFCAYCTVKTKKKARTITTEKQVRK